MNPKQTAKREILVIMSILGLITLFPIQMAYAQTGATVNVNPQMSVAQVNDTFTVNITISNVQNLFGLELTVTWNASILQLVTANSRLGVQSYPDGVLYGTRLNYDDNSLVSGDIYVEDNSTSQAAGEYHLAAACVGGSSSFSGAGNLVILTFQVKELGQSAINVQSTLADKPVLGEDTSNPITHTDLNGSVEVVIPEFPALAVVCVLMAFVSLTLVFSKKVVKKKRN
jgi:hypothetical protein